MKKQESKTGEAAYPLAEHKITVLLVDDQAMIGEAVRRMLAEDPEIEFHFCQDPTSAVQTANEISPTVILQDLVMPELDGLTLVKFFRANRKTQEVPLIVLSTKEEPKVKAEAFALGANDYLVKLPDKIELIARIRHHSQGYINLLQRNEAYRALAASQKTLTDELAQAAAYVKSLLPAPMDDEIKTDWRFIPSTSLGGDSFGYKWLDEENFSMFLLDVCGHGVGSALLSVSALNVLNSQTLYNVDMRNPKEVLDALNESFQMEKHNDLYFTIWYGVFNKVKRRLAYSSGGHPPAILFTGETPETAEILQLKTPGLIIGGMRGSVYQSEECGVGSFSKLFFFSDGVYEIFKPDNTPLEFGEFVEQLTKACRTGSSDIDNYLEFTWKYQSSKVFEDDFSMVEVIF